MRADLLALHHVRDHGYPNPESITDVFQNPKSKTQNPTILTDEPSFHRIASLVAAGWLLTGLATSVVDYSLKFLLKGDLALKASELAGSLAPANIPIYIKPLAGILSDSVPLFGSRRRSYFIL